MGQRKLSRSTYGIEDTLCYEYFGNALKRETTEIRIFPKCIWHLIFRRCTETRLHVRRDLN